jgi:hypothetical protein
MQGKSVIEPSWFARFWEYLSAAGIYWWAGLAVLVALERYAERIAPDFWKEKVDSWFTPTRRKQALVLFAVLAFFYGNFRAFDAERSAKEYAISERAKPALDPTAIYQDGFPVGSITQPKMDIANNLIAFDVVTAPHELVMT